MTPIEVVGMRIMPEKYYWLGRHENGKFVTTQVGAKGIEWDQLLKELDELKANGFDGKFKTGYPWIDTVVLNVIASKIDGMIEDAGLSNSGWRDIGDVGEDYNGHRTRNGRDNGFRDLTGR